MEGLTAQQRQMIHEAAVILGRLGGLIGGKSRTPAKRQASRENGCEGGRPCKPWRELTKAGRYARKRREQSRKAESAGYNDANL